jgi:diketogulonate reductase-like aldo/keto reductase
VRQAIDCGFRGFDTAGQPKHYNEAGVGAALGACLRQELTRADFYLQSKFTSLSGQDPRQVPYDPAAPLAEQVAQSFRSSLRNLETDYVDCYILHAPMPSPSQTADAWQAMETIADSGRARTLGISNCYGPSALETLHRTARIKPAVVQNRFYAATDYDREIRAFCQQRAMIYQSFWTLTANPQLLAHRTVTDLATRYSRTPAQVLFRYLTQTGVVPLTGTTSQAHMREDLAIFEWSLTLPECTGMAALL